MAITNPSININGTSELQQALGGYNNVEDICQSSLINKWAKYKPFCSTEKGYNLEQMQAAARAANYGIGVPESKDGHPEQCYDNGNDWTYDKPDAAPYVLRLGDFRGYNHAALAPIYGTDRSIKINMFWSSSATLSCFVNSGEYDINLTDLSVSGAALSSYYLAVTWVVGSTRYVKTASSTIGNGGLSIILYASDFNNAVGTYSAIIIGASTQMSVRSTAMTGTFIPLPCPSSQRSYFSGASIVISDSHGLTFGTKYLCNSVNGTFVDDRTYLYIDNDTFYTDDNGRGRVFIKTAITNTNDNAVVIYANKLYMIASRSLNINDYSSGTDYYRPTLYDEYGTQQSTISIAAGATASVIIGYMTTDANHWGLLCMPKINGGTIGQISARRVGPSVITIWYGERTETASRLFNSSVIGLQSSNY